MSVGAQLGGLGTAEGVGGGEWAWSEEGPVVQQEAAVARVLWVEEDLP